MKSSQLPAHKDSVPLDDMKLKRAQELSLQALSYARNVLLVNLRFLESALCRFRFMPGDDPENIRKYLHGVPVETLATNGEFLFFNSRYVLTTFQEHADRLIHDYLHIVMHCIFCHSFADMLRAPLWDLACDIAVEMVIEELNLKNLEDERTEQQRAVFYRLRQQLKVVSAEKIYALYRNLTDEECAIMRSAFFSDDHSLWYIPAGLGAGEGEDGIPGGASSQAELYETWQKLSRQIQLDLETFNKQKGDAAGCLMQNLKDVNRERYDYTAFLRKFAVLGETMKTNDEEFDYNFYCYGLSLYRDMPLIESLEYKEVKRIRDFVIAIDTSGSVSGELVQNFVQKTYNILKSTDSFFSKINLHILQCDTEIQEAVKITKQEEFDEYLKHMKLKGFGGTSFRPVFAYVDELIAKKEFQNLRGLIYFTDGYGDFPKRAPDYLTAMVFVEGASAVPKTIPPWVIKLVLDPEDCQEVSDV